MDSIPITSRPYFTKKNSLISTKLQTNTKRKKSHNRIIIKALDKNLRKILMEIDGPPLYLQDYLQVEMLILTYKTILDQRANRH